MVPSKSPLLASARGLLEILDGAMKLVSRLLKQATDTWIAHGIMVYDDTTVTCCLVADY